MHSTLMDQKEGRLSEGVRRDRDKTTQRNQQSKKSFLRSYAGIWASIIYPFIWQTFIHGLPYAKYLVSI